MAVNVVGPRTTCVIFHVGELARHQHLHADASEVGDVGRVVGLQVHNAVGVNRVGEEIAAVASRGSHRHGGRLSVGCHLQLCRAAVDAVVGAVGRVATIGRVVFNPAIVLIVGTAVGLHHVDAFHLPFLDDAIIGELDEEVGVFHDA